MNPYREPSKSSSRLREFFVNRITRITPLTVVLAAVLIAGVSLAATAALRVNGVQFGASDSTVYVTAFGADGSNVADSAAAFQAAINAAPSGGKIKVPSGTYHVNTTLTLSSRNVVFVGDGRSKTVITGPSAGSIFTPSGTLTQIEIAGLTLNCSGAGSKLIDLTGVTAQEGWLSIHDNLIQHCQSFAITTGVSTYINTIRDNTFLDDAGGISILQHSDTLIDHNFFENTRSGAVAAISIASSDIHVTRNYFVTGGTGFTGPDILINPIDGDGLSGGYDWITQNKFGSESDTANRAKIQCSNANTTYPCGPVIVNENHFLGNPAGSTAILLSNPIARWIVKDNYFKDITKIVDDVQTITSTSISAVGESTFGPGNVFFPSTAWTFFTNGGRNFGTIYAPHLTSSTLPSEQRQIETIELRNRVAWSEDLSNAAWVKTGVSITTGQADPYGTTRAVLLTRSNAATFENVQVAIDNTSMLTRFVVSFWGKAGSATSLQTSVYDNTSGSFTGQLGYYQLGSAWSRYRFVANGLTAGHSYILFVYPVNTTQSAGTINLFGVQVADYDSDYVPTAGAVTSTTSFGMRTERGIEARGFDAPTAETLFVGNTNASGVALGKAASTTTVMGSLAMGSTKVVATTTAPTISSGFGTSPSVVSNNGTLAFTINVGTGGVATSGVIGLPTISTGWNCYCEDRTTMSTTVFRCRQTASSTSSATIGNFTSAAAAGAWVASDVLAVSCFAY